MVCPECRSNDLDLKILKQNGENIEEGEIECNQCTSKYLITKGITRMNTFRKGSNMDNWSINAKQTQKNYSFWWSNIKKDDEYEDNYRKRLELRSCLNKKQFDGQIVLDVGCGSGALSKAAIEFGAKHVIAIDITSSVDNARKNLKHFDNIDFIQADISNLPFIEEFADIVFSIGVLHHTPEPDKSFNRIAKLLKYDGYFSVYLYSSTLYKYDNYLQRLRGDLKHIMQNQLRKLTFRSPSGLILLFARLLTNVGMAIYLLKNKGNLLFYIGRFMQAIFPTAIYFPSEDFGSNVARNYDYYCTPYNHNHSAEEVILWYVNQNFDNLILGPYPLCVSGQKKIEIPEKVSIKYSKESFDLHSQLKM